MLGLDVAYVRADIVVSLLKGYEPPALALFCFGCTPIS